MNSKELFHYNLSRLMAERSLNASKLAAAAGIAQPQLSSLRTHRRFPQAETLDKLAAVLGVMPAAFFAPPATEE